MTDRELMQQALEALNHVNVQDRMQIITALRSRLAQPEQEPVALVIDGVLVKSELPEKYTGHLYTTPPQRKPEQEPIKESSITHGHLWIGDLYGKEKNNE